MTVLSTGITNDVDERAGKAASISRSGGIGK